jgi:hypothetical protein
VPKYRRKKSTFILVFSSFGDGTRTFIVVATFSSDLQIVVFWENGHPGREETRPSQQDGTGKSAHYTA